MNKRLIAPLLATLLASTLHAKSVSPEELKSDWNFYGMGSAAAQNRMFYMEEAEGSKGVMIVSPEAYEGDITIRYELMPMNAASVCVAVLFATDAGESTTLTMPDNFDGSMGHWVNNVDNYFFAFHNMAHDRKPFAIRFPTKDAIGEAENNVMRAGEFHTIEIVRKGESLSLSINGKRHFVGKDPNRLESGHLAFRIRGIPQIPAACLIRNLTIETSN